MKTLTTLATNIVSFINDVLVPLIFAVAFIVFLFGVFRYLIAGAANPEKRQTGQQMVMYSLIGFAVMISVWGLVNLLVGTFGFDSNTRPCLPTFSGDCSSASGSNADSQPTNLLPPGEYTQTTDDGSNGDFKQGNEGLGNQY